MIIIYFKCSIRRDCKQCNNYYSTIIYNTGIPVLYVKIHDHCWPSSVGSYDVLYSVSQKKMVRVEMRHFDHNISIFSTALYVIFKITKLALKYRSFH